MHHRTPGSGVAVREDAGPAPLRLLSVSRSVMCWLTRCGRLKSVTQGRQRPIPASAIADYVDLLRREADDGPA